jgi:superfamily II DNA or RNA helicase
MKLIRRSQIDTPQKTYNLHIERDHNYVANGAVVANCHTIKGKELKSLLCGALSDVPIRWGVTGSVPKEDHESICLLAAIGPLIGTLSAAELQEKGVLANCKIEIRQLIDPDYEFADYQEEHEFLLTDPQRLAYVAKLIEGWAATGNTMVLVDRIESGKRLQKLIPDSVFVSGSTKETTRQREYNSIQTATNKIIVATYGIAAVGINIPRLFNLVILEPGKSYVRNTQAAGRILRRANDKSDAVIYDVCSSLKFSARHLTKRKTYYAEAGYPVQKVRLRYP